MWQPFSSARRCGGRRSAWVSRICWKGRSQPPAKGEAGGAAKSNADVAEAEAKRIAEAEAKRKAQAARDPALSVTPRSGKTFQDRLVDGDPCPMCPEMVVAPAGAFTMGSPPGEPARAPGEAQVRVTIDRPFAVGKFAITFDQWDACTADGGCNGYRPSDPGWGRGDRPVINVNWNDATAYAEWLSRKTGKTFRLLSEAEREYVTRAGATTHFGGVLPFHRPKPTMMASTAAREVSIGRRLFRLTVSRQTLGACSTYMGTCGSGGKIAGTIAIKATSGVETPE
jgi:hypothetical protein